MPVALAAAAFWILSAPLPAYAERDAAALERPGDAAKGRIVFAAGDCASCHASPGQTDRLRLGGGMALASPFGTLRPPNISPDQVYGIGRWRTVDLANALLGGVSPDGRHYYPAFPYTSFVHMTVDDVRDLMAYLRTLPPVAGRPPANDLPFPFNIRRLIGLWKLVFFDRRPLRPDAAQDAAWNRGRYLVEAVAHCAECHSSRNVFFAIKDSKRFAGARDPSGTGFAPNITPAGIGWWSDADLERLLRDGHTPDMRTVGSSMASVVDNMATLPPADRHAIVSYVRSLRARPTPPP